MQNHKSSAGDPGKPQHLEENDCYFLHFYQIIHRGTNTFEALKSVILSDMIIGRFLDEKVIHSQVIHSSRIIVRFFTPEI